MTLKRNVLNGLMAILFLLLMNYRFTGNMPHEILGLVIFLLFLVHTIWNICWYKTFFKGKQKTERILSTIINFLLVIAFVVTIGSGLLISQTVLPVRVFHNMSMVLLMHDIHQGSGYAVYLLVAIHLGMHWDMLWLKAKRWLRIEHYKTSCAVIGNILAVTLIIYGIYTSFVNHIGSKIFMQHDFVGWGKAPSTVQILIDYFSIFGCYTAITSYLRSLFRLKNNDIFYKTTKNRKREI